MSEILFCHFIGYFFYRKFLSFNFDMNFLFLSIRYEVGEEGGLFTEKFKCITVDF